MTNNRPQRECPGSKCKSVLRPNEHICRRCVTKAERAVADLPALLSELDRSIAKQTSGKGGAIGHGGESKVPIDLGAMVKRERAKVLVSAACEVGYRVPTFDLPGVVFAVLTDPSKMQFRAAGPELAAAIHRTVAEWRGVIDTEGDRVYAGRCEQCGSEMYARRDRKTFDCPGCGSGYDTAQSLDWIEGMLRETLWPIHLIREALATWKDVRVSDSTVRSWRRRGQLIARGLDVDGRETYRVGDYLDLVEQHKPRNAETVAQ